MARRGLPGSSTTHHPAVNPMAHSNFVKLTEARTGQAVFLTVYNITSIVPEYIGPWWHRKLVTVVEQASISIVHVRESSAEVEQAIDAKKQQLNEEAKALRNRTAYE